MKTNNYANKKNYINDLNEPYSLTDPNFIALHLVKPNTKVLSLGCGTGREIDFLVKLGCKVTAIEINEDIINLAKINQPNAEYHQMNMLEYLEPDTFDYIVCLYNTINYLNKEERKILIKNCYKNLNLMGTLIITSEDCLSRIGAFKTWLLGDDYYYKKSEIEEWFFFEHYITKLGTYNLIIGRK